MTRADRSSSRTHGPKGTGRSLGDPGTDPSSPIENPIPHLKEARGAATRIVSLQRELLTLKAEHLAKTQAKRAGFGIGAGVAAFFALFFFLGWFSFFLHERGVASAWLAVGMLLLFGSLAAWAGWKAWKMA